MIAYMSVLPELLRSATRDLHAEAERAGVMGELIRGRLPLPGYVALLRNLHALYQALEARELPVPALNRTDALSTDLDVLEGPCWRHGAPLATATSEYIERVRAAGPPALAAHAYVRYLGDLHGGQILAAVVRKSFGLPAGLGTAFYEFGPEAAVRTLRSRLREALVALDLGVTELHNATLEARWAFAQHIRLFEELQRTAASSTA